MTLQLNFSRLVRARCNGEFVAASSCLLTRLLHESVGGNSRTAIIATISSLQRDLKATLHTLSVARQAMLVPERPKFNFASRKETPHLGRGKSRAGQSISLMHRFSTEALKVAPVSIRTLALEDARVGTWKKLTP